MSEDYTAEDFELRIGDETVGSVDAVGVGEVDGDGPLRLGLTSNEHEFSFEATWIPQEGDPVVFAKVVTSDPHPPCTLLARPGETGRVQGVEGDQVAVKKENGTVIFCKPSDILPGVFEFERESTFQIHPVTGAVEETTIPGTGIEVRRCQDCGAMWMPGRGLYIFRPYQAERCRGERW